MNLKVRVLFNKSSSTKISRPINFICLTYFKIYETKIMAYYYGAIAHLYIPEEIIRDDGFAHLEKGIGLDGYAIPQLLQRFSHARPNEKTTSLDGS